MHEGSNCCIMDVRLHKHNSSSSSNTSVMSEETKKQILENNKNVIRVLRSSWKGPIPMQYNVETGKEEYWLSLDFVNFEGWCTEAFIKAEILKFEERRQDNNK